MGWAEGRGVGRLSYLTFAIFNSKLILFQGIRSQTSTPDSSPTHRPDRDANTSFAPIAPVDKNPVSSTSSGGFMSWVPGIRSTAAQSSADKTTAVVGPSKSATEEMVCWDCKL